MFYIILSAVVFVAVISIDLFACAFAYGAAKVYVPFKKILAINLIGKVIVGTGLFIGYFIGGFMPDAVGIWLGFGVLLTVGVIKVIQWLLARKKTNQSTFRSITWRESIVLGVVLSLDGLAAGIGVTLTLLSLVFVSSVLVISIITDQLIFMGAQRLGKLVTKKATLDLGWLSGFILITVSICKLFIELFTS